MKNINKNNKEETDYEIIENIYEGNISKIYRVKKKNTNETFIIKVGNEKSTQREINFLNRVIFFFK